MGVVIPPGAAGPEIEEAVVVAAVVGVAGLVIDVVAVLVV